MRFVRVELLQDGSRGYSLNADPYLNALPQLAPDLPPMAREFATDSEHYNFFGSRCVKDLQLGSLSLMDNNDRLSLALWLLPNKFKHDEGLLIKYVDVISLHIDVSSAPRQRNVWPDTRRLGDVQLDEILPHDAGCSHEIKMTGGEVRVVCADLAAEWREAPVVDDL